jgi:hypothetical protein
MAAMAYLKDIYAECQHKVPPPYARAEKNARALNGRRDDELYLLFLLVTSFIYFCS